MKEESKKPNQDEGLSGDFFNAQASLLSELEGHASKIEEKFFEELESHLNKLCKLIAQAVKADSVAIFFATEETQKPEMVMRGACGQLLNSLKAHSNWRQRINYDLEIVKKNTWRRDPAHGLIVVAKNGKELHFRVFDPIPNPNPEGFLGSLVFARSDRQIFRISTYDWKGELVENRNFALTAKIKRDISDLERQLDDSWDRAVSGQRSKELIPIILSILGLTEEPSGVRYTSLVEGDEWKRASPEKRRELLDVWSVTHQIWHLSRARLANSNNAMDELHGGKGRAGKGDSIAYPMKSLRDTFRSMLGVPIFVRGGSGEDFDVGLPEEDDSLRDEFISKYRVVGILKVEGRRPTVDLFQESSEDGIKKTVIDLLKESFKFGHIDKQWVDDFLEALAKDSTQFPDTSYRVGNEGFGDRAERIKSTADVLTELLRAKFAQHDIELLVLFAMQIGRIMVQRVIRHAASKDYKIALTENDVGILNIRWKDIRDLALLRKAAEAARKKIEYELSLLKSELDYKAHCEVYASQVNELMQPRGAIREIQSGPKTMVSLFQKLVRKQIEQDYTAPDSELGIVGFKMTIKSPGRLAERRSSMRGKMTLEVEPPRIGYTQVKATADLGLKGGPRASISPKDLKGAMSSHERQIDLEVPLIKRILDSEFYGIDDIARARIIADYLSDLDEVQSELRSRLKEWGIQRFQTMDVIEDGKSDGYRGIHITVFVDVVPLLAWEDAQELMERLYGRQSPRLEIPVEIQLCTAYERSWSDKAHNLLYKRESNISPELQDSLRILSNLLYQADELSDVVRNSIERLLLPDDYGEMKLLDYLRPRLSSQGFVQVKLGLACCKEIQKDCLRYGGLPRHSFSIEVCERLVSEFGVLDTDMLLLALFRDIWDQPSEFSIEKSPLGRLKELINKSCREIFPWFLSQLYDSREPDVLLDQWLENFPKWFWEVQESYRKYFQSTALKTELSEKRKRLRDLQGLIEKHFQGVALSAKKRLSRDDRNQEEILRQINEYENWLERVYVLEAAILLAQLTDLPRELSQGRRKRLFRDYFGIYGEIRQLLPNQPMKSKVIEVLDKAFREIATDLEIALPMDLYE